MWSGFTAWLKLFQSTRSLRSATNAFPSHCFGTLISIHALLAERDSKSQQINAINSFDNNQMPHDFIKTTVRRTVVKRGSSHIHADTRCEGGRKWMGAWGSHRSDDQRFRDIISLFGADMFHFVLIMIPQIVKTQTVLVTVDDLFQLMLNHTALSSIKNAFENRILNPLTIIDAFLGHFAQPIPTLRVFRVDIIRDQYQHRLRLLP